MPGILSLLFDCCLLIAWLSLEVLALTRLPTPASHPAQLLLVFRLRQLEGDEGAEGVERLDDGLNTLWGCRQKDLLKWYYDYLAKK